MIHRPGDISQSPIHRQPHDLTTPGIDGIYLPLVPHLQQWLDIELVDKPSHRISRGTDNGNRLWAEYVFQMWRAHLVDSKFPSITRKPPTSGIEVSLVALFFIMSSSQICCGSS